MRNRSKPKSARSENQKRRILDWRNWIGVRWGEDDSSLDLRFRSERLEPRMLLTADTTGLPDWISQGPGPITGGQILGIPQKPVVGAIEAIAAHPTNPDLIYVGAANGGVWRTDNSRRAIDGVDNDGDGVVDAEDLDEQPTWTPLTDQFPSLSISALAMDPNDLPVPGDPTKGTLYAGTGNVSSFTAPDKKLKTDQFSVGILKTTDGGKSWQLFSSVFVGKTINAILPTTISQGSGHLVLVAANDGLYQSTDGGAGNFVKVAGGLPAVNNNVTDLEADPNNTQRFYVAIAGQGIFRSNDGATTWTATGSLGMATSASTRIEMSIGSSLALGPSPVYAAVLLTPQTTLNTGSAITDQSLKLQSVA